MKATRTQWLAACALAVYAALLIRYVVFKATIILRLGHLRFRYGGTRTGAGNLVPFKTIAPLMVGRGNHWIAMLNLLGNIVPFMPIGILASLVFPFLSWPKALVLGIVIGLTIEVMEVIFHVGIFDVDDVILNASGVILGYGIFAAFRQQRPVAS